MGVQVQTLYLKEGGKDKIPASLRPFYSFNWGGKDIEEFNLVATLTNDGLSKNLYSDFEDTTKDYTEVDGQQYYRTTMKANTLSFSLATDGMSEKELKNFKNFFRPGRIEYLILAEHPYRRIKARVSATPSMSMVPFEKDEEIKLIEEVISVKTTEYKGTISLSFTMDYPYWESTVGIIPESDNEIDKYKAILEDGLPVAGAIKDSGILYSGFEGLINLTKSEEKYLYYCGTAPSYPIIEFDLNIKPDDDGYIRTIGNKYSSEPYSFLQIGDEKLCYTLPGLFSSYNEVIKILKNYSDGNSYEDLMTDIRENVVDYYMRSAVIGILNDGTYNKNGSGSLDGIDNLKTNLKNLIGGSTGINTKFTINCKTGKASLSCEFKGMDLIENCGDMIVSKYISIKETNSYNADGYITNGDCIKIVSSIDINNFKIDYKYMYL